MNGYDKAQREYDAQDDERQEFYDEQSDNALEREYELADRWRDQREDRDYERQRYSN